jgi:hypothetical protein
MDKFKPTEYYIVYDFETMEEPLNNNDENIMIEREDDDSSSSSLSQPSSNPSSPTKITTKISHVVLFSAAWAAKTKSGIKTAYFDRRDGDDFIIKWLKSLVEVAGEVSKDNMYDFINYMTENIPNFVPVLGFNSARFDINFIIDILHNPPHWYIEFIIGNLNYFKMVSVRTFDGLCLKFLDTMNYPPPQTLDSFVKTFGNVKHKIDLIQLIIWKWLTKQNLLHNLTSTPSYVTQTLVIKITKHTSKIGRLKAFQINGST